MAGADVGQDLFCAGPTWGLRKRRSTTGQEGHAFVEFAIKPVIWTQQKMNAVYVARDVAQDGLQMVSIIK